MLDLHADWKMVDWDRELEGRVWVAGVEGCLVANVGSKEGVADPGKGRVMRETCVLGCVMGKEGT